MLTESYHVWNEVGEKLKKKEQTSARCHSPKILCQASEMPFHTKYCPKMEGV